jgi:hypothetical protein
MLTMVPERRAHVRQHQLRKAGKAEEIHLELPARLLQRHVLDRAHGAVTCAIDQHIDAAFVVNDALYALNHRRVVGNVHAE